ncbi:glycosyltransferase [Aphanothece hegewaldii]|uniref:glycosyltransferase n=1 Tax=Aphanothece hegewaldii TaxID=1521625 RepID=UPI001FEA9A5A|nr:glycosyltransferase [Aphanothece hegewaldii]
MSSPEISVIIPSYNGERYIVQAIDSVRIQQNCSYEIIIIDDGSTDQTRDVLQSYNNQIHYVYQDNQGVSAARNKGIELSRGEFIAFLDADDYFLPDKLAAQLAVFKAQPELGIVHSGWCRVNSQGNPIVDVCPWQNVPNLDLESWLIWKPVLPSAMMFRREWLVKVGGFDSRFPPAEDTELILRLALKGCQANWLRKITVCYRQHEQSSTNQGLPQARSLTNVIEHFFSQPDLPISIRFIEKRVRYGTFVWIAWYLYSTGHPALMAEYLKKAWLSKPYLPTDSIINWIESFSKYSSNLGETFDAYCFTSLPEWQDLTKWLIAYIETESLSTTSNASFSNLISNQISSVKED